MSVDGWAGVLALLIAIAFAVGVANGFVWGDWLHVTLCAAGVLLYGWLAWMCIAGDEG